MSWRGLPAGSLPRDVVRIAVGLVLIPAVAILVLSFAMVQLLPEPGSLLFPLFLVPLAAALLAGGVLLLLSSRELSRMSKNQALFVAQASHELRTPLTTLRFLASGLEDREKAQALENVVAVLEAGIHRLIDWGRLTGGQLRLRLLPVSVAHVVGEALRRTEASLAARGQRVVRSGLEDASVWADQEAAVSALVNLLTNASKYSPPGSTVELGIGEKGEWVTVWVRDQGVGIAPGLQRKIFRPFFRLPFVESQGVEGFGLGLAIVSQVMAAQGGKVTLYSKPGEGSCFTLWFRRGQRA
ncbi:Signal-transduction histidine kinase senX3 [bacterium HR09]|nr:Signal-transduction histidine kinase senX3 [bacterium HR09]